MQTMKKNWPAVAFLALAALIACVYTWLQLSDDADKSSPERGAAPTAVERSSPSESSSEAAASAATPEPTLDTPGEPVEAAAPSRVETPRKKLSDLQTEPVRGVVDLPAGVPQDELLEVLVFTGIDYAQRSAMDTAEHELEALDGLVARAPVGADGAFAVEAPVDADCRIALRGRYCFVRESKLLTPAERETPLRIEAELGAWVYGRIELPLDASADQRDLSKCGLKLQFDELQAAGAGRALQRGLLREYTTHASPEWTFEFRGVAAGNEYDLRIAPDNLAARKTSAFKLSAGERKSLQVELTQGGAVRGRVVDEEGKPVKGAELLARIDPQMFGQGGFRVRKTSSDAEGAFELLHVAAGQVRVRTEADGFIETDSQFEVAERGDLADTLITLKRGSSLSGGVRWSDGRPAVGVEVTVGFDVSALMGMGAFNAMQGASGKAVTDESGAFSVTGLGKGPFSVKASQTVGEGDDAKLWIGRAEHVAPDTHDLALVLSAPRAIVGRVVDRDGAPVSPIIVTAREQTGGPIAGLGGERRQETSTDPDGRFEIRGLAPGSWLVDAISEGFTRSSAVEVSLGADADAAPIELVLHRGGSVSGTVRTPSGEPVPGAEVTLKLSVAEMMRNMRTDDEGLSSGPSVTSDAEGRFKLTGLEVGQRVIVAKKSGWAESEPTSVDIAPESELTDTVLTLRRGGRILGLVYDNRGEPLGGASILVQLSSDPLLQMFVKSDLAGEFVVDSIAPGDWNVIHMPTQNAQPSSDDQGADMMSMLSDMKMAAAHVVDGEDTHVALGAPPKSPVRVHGVISHAGEPTAGVMVTLLADGGEGLESMKFTRTNSAGEYDTTLRQPGRYLFNVQKIGDAGQQQTVARSLVVPETEDFRHDLELPGGAIRGRVFDVDGAPAARARVTLSVDGPVPNATLLGANYCEITTDANGEYELQWLDSGEYSVAVGGSAMGGMFGGGNATSGRQVRDRVKVRDGEIVDGVDFRLRKPGRIVGVVRSASGAPAKDATIFLRDSDGRPLERFSLVVTDAAGHFEYEGVDAGAYTVVARTAAEVSGESPAVRVREGEVGEVSLALGPGTLLIVSLSDSEGNLVDCAVEVLDDQGRRVNGMMSMAGIMEAFSKGLFSSREQRVGPLPPGRYKVIVTTDGGGKVSKPVTLTGQPERRLNVRL